MGLAVSLTALAPLAPFRDAVAGTAATGVSQTRPLAYLLGAPVFGIWDVLSLLTVSQHYAVLATLAALYLSWRRRAFGLGRVGEAHAPIRRRLLREAGILVGCVGGLLGFYLAGALVPRPMVGLAVEDPDQVIVDFHSHTRWSHDAWSVFSAERNREWHRSAGFHAAFVTDHYTWQGVDEAAPENPLTAADGVLLLEGAEVRIRGRPTNALGYRAPYIGALDPDSVHLDEARVGGRTQREPWVPTLLFTMPGPLWRLVPFDAESRSGVVGIEIHDGSPRGLEQTRSERAEIVALADSLDLALVSASNLHGWGRTAGGWSLMELPGWRGNSSDELAQRITEALHAGRRESVRVVERSIEYHDGSSVRIALTVPLAFLTHARTLSWEERTSWLLWLLALALLLRVRRSGAARRERPETSSLLDSA